MRLMLLYANTLDLKNIFDVFRLIIDAQGEVALDVYIARGIDPPGHPPPGWPLGGHRSETTVCVTYAQACRRMGRFNRSRERRAAG